MGDQDARLKVTADTSGAVAPLEKLESQQEAVGAAGKQAGAETSTAYANAAKAVDAFASAAEKGGKGAERGLALATIQVEKFEKEIADLKAQGRPTAALEAGLDSLKAKLQTSTGELGRFRAAAADAADATRKSTQRAGEFSGSITDIAGTLKTLSPELGNAIDKYSIFAAKAFIAIKALDAAAVAMKSVAIATDSYNGDTKALIDSTGEFTRALTSLDLAGAAAALGKLGGSALVAANDLSETTVQLGKLADASKAEKFAGILKVQKDLIVGHEEEIAKLEQKGQALLREIEVQRESGEVKKFLLTELKKLLDAYDSAQEKAPEAVRKIAAELGVLSSAQTEAAKTAEDHATKATEGASRRAAAEEDASKRSVAAIQAEVEARKKALADAEAALNKATQEAISDGGGVRSDPALQGRADEAQKSVDQLTGKIAELESMDFLSPEQRSQLDSMKSQLAGASQAAQQLARDATLGTTAIIDQAEATDLLAKNADLLSGIYEELDQGRLQSFEQQKKANAEAAQLQERATKSAGQFGEAVEGAADSLSDAAKAAGATASATDKIADAGKKLNEDDPGKKFAAGMAEAEPIAARIAGYTREIVQNLRDAAEAMGGG